MNDQKSIEEFIDSPDTIDFVVRQGEYLTKFIRDNPGVIVTQTIEGRYVVCYAKTSDFMNIIAQLGTGFISAAPIILGLMDHENIDAAGITQVQESNLNLNGKGVVIGFIDTGIDYTLDVFRYEDGTSKIQFIYDQTARGNTPEGFFIGTEYTNAQINEALKAANPYDIVPQQDTVGHGTFLASVAAGRKVGEYFGAAPGAELIVVKLKKARQFYLDLYAVPDNQENAYESSAVMIGIEYILQKASQLDRPVAICIGLGSNFGGHDGFTLFEEFLSGISILRGVCVCIAAGNESQARHHMQGVIPNTGDTQNIDLRVGENAGDVYVSIWNTVSDKFSVSVRSPAGELVGRVPAVSDKVSDFNLILEKASVRIEYHFPVEGSGGQNIVVKLLNASPGTWTITLYGDIVLNGTYHAWLPITGFTAPGVEFLATTPYTTITVPGTTIGSICCGAYNDANNILYAESSWGPTRGMIMAPDFIAPGVDVGGFYPGGHGTMSGTSVATAITAGAAALMLQWGVVNKNEITISTYQIRAYLIRGCTRSEGINYPNPQTGYGEINLIQTFQFMREV